VGKPSDIIDEGTIIRFGCFIMLPREGAFPLAKEFDKNPEKFIEAWIKGAISNIYHGPSSNPKNEETGELEIMPKVIVRYVPNKSWR